LVLGANIGNVIPQFVNAGSNTAARRLALGNMLMRGIACLVAIPLLPSLAQALSAIEPGAARQVADFHLLFNVALALVFIGLLDPLARVCVKLLPSPAGADRPAGPHYINPRTIGPPGMALADAAREVLRMVDIVEAMLRTFLQCLQDNDRKLLPKLKDMDDVLDALHTAVKLHLTDVSRAADLSDADARRCADVLAFAINLEQIGDILDKSLRGIAAKKIKRRLTFSQEGRREIEGLHERLLGNLRLAQSVFERPGSGADAACPEGRNARAGAGSDRQSSAKIARRPIGKYRDQLLAP
jgi:phosphate:Na+ symporter